MRITKTASILAILSALASFAPRAGAQQFQGVTVLPGPVAWTEGVECADVDNDGDLDIFFAEGDGYSTAGTKRQNILLINKLVETGTPWLFVDESVARLGVHVSNAKMVVTGDVNGDGWVDVLFCNAFNTDPPFLYINQGAANPGYFTMESATRGLTTAYNSGGAQFGDLDDDGDLDLIINDGYQPNSGKPHLFFNDGTGHFTENAAALNAPTKSSQMDVQLVDIDNDWDLDFFGCCRATNAGGNHYLMLNDGTGHFTDVSSILAAGNGNTYEAECGDLDGDGDVDLFFVSLSGFAEGAVKNNLIPSGPLSFTNQAALADNNDDNEIALFDYDNDGDYDVLVGSLSNSHETMWKNNGGFSFTNVAIVQNQSDSTLDLTVADLNNDGKYDIITAQGESGTFGNKLYKNTGTADTLPPVLVGQIDPGSAPAAGPVVAHGKIRDQVLDDGVNYVRGTASYVINTVPQSASVTINAGAFSPPVLNVVAGTTVTWTNSSGGNQSVKSTTSPYTYDSGTIANAATYAFTFVSPGTYAYTSMPSGLSAQVVVSGSATTIKGTYSGGQIYRFAMTDTAGGTGVQLCYELRFTDWPGNVLVTNTRTVTLTGGSLGTQYCFGDGSLATACPCGNSGTTGNGCANSANGLGAHLGAIGTASPDTVALNASGELPTVLSIFLQGDLNAATGIVFGDGVRCVNGTLKRLYAKNAGGGAVSAPQGGDLSVTAQSAALGDTITPGSTRYYQVYYRDSNLAFCPTPLGNSWNVTNAVSIAY